MTQLELNWQTEGNTKGVDDTHQGSEVRTPTEHDFQGPKWLLEQSLHSALFSPITSIH